MLSKIKKNDNPVVSVIIPTYNRAQWLRRAIKSVLHQTYRNFEIIVVDDGSADNTYGTVRSIESSKIHYISHSINRGSAISRNTGLRVAKGKYIGFLDDDDEWLPYKLEKQVAKFSVVQETVGVVYSGSSIVSARSGKTIHEFTAHSSGHKDIDFLRTVTFTTSVPLIRKSCFHIVGGFDETLPGAQDKDMWIRLARCYEFNYIPDILVKRYIHGDQISTNLKAKIEAKEKIVSKYYDMLTMHPEIMAHHLRRLGILYCIDGRSFKGMSCFGKAIQQQPCKLELYKDFFLSLAAPQIHRRLLLKESIGNVDGIRLYY